MIAEWIFFLHFFLGPPAGREDTAKIREHVSSPPCCHASIVPESGETQAGGALNHRNLRTD